jgi:trigger factor
MEFSTKRVDSANLSISATITKDDIDKNLENIAKELSQTANIPGFRKGKIPAKAVKQFYGSRLVEDAEAKSLSEVLEAGQKEAGVESSQIITEPTFSKFEKVEGNIEVEIEVSLRPTVELGDYLSLVPDIPTPEVSDDEVLARITEMLEKKAGFLEVDRAIENGDSVTFDFEGFLNGEPFEGGKAENYTLKIGSGNFVPGFEEQLIGLSKDDEKEIEVTFPEEYHAENLKGQKTIFKCKIRKIEIKETLELSDENANELLSIEVSENETQVDALKRETKLDLENEKLSKIYNEQTKPQLRANISDYYTFDLPKSVVNSEIEQRVNQEANTMSEEEITELQGNVEKIKELQEKMRPEAERSVRTTFVINELGRVEGLSVSDDELRNIISYEAYMGGQNPQDVIDNYENQGLMPLVKMSILEDKVLSKLIEKKR